MSETRKREENNHKGRAGLVLGVLALILLVALLAVLIIAVIRLKDAPAGTGLFPAAQDTARETDAAAPASDETAGRSIRFRLGDETLQVFLLAEGETLPAWEPALPGLRLLGWLDEQGEPVDPWAVSIDGDRIFTADTLPGLRAHTAFLFTDEEGFLRPDEPLQAAELKQALEALLPEGEPMPDGLPAGGTVDGEVLKTALAGCLTPEERAALTGEPLSRRAFARLIAAVCGWSEDERLIPEPEALAPADLSPADADFALLLEAAVPHRADEAGTPWSAAALPTGREPGMFLLGTTLCCCGRDGYLLRDADVGPLHFGPDGCFSSGDEELDGYVTECLGALMEQFPEDARDRMAMLRHCYDYVRDKFVYLGRGHQIEEGTDWSAEDAKIMFRTGKGNCYNYAAAFRALARRLGYPANTVLRSLDTPDNEHAWTDIVIDGIPYVFDPQLEAHWNNDRWMLRYEDAKKYGYRRPDPAVFLGYEAYADMKYEQPPREEGKVFAEEYQQGETYLVYLPYGYDPQQQYNVLIYLNGADGDPYKMLGTDYRYSHGNTYFQTAVNTKYYIDYLIQEGYCDPLIVVSTNEIIADWIGDRYLRLIQYTVEHYSTYAASPEVEDLIAARDHFAIAGPSNASQSICAAIQTMPDIFAYYGLFSGMYQQQETLEAFRQKGEIRFLMMAAGEQDYQWPVMEDAYEVWAKLDNVDDSCLMIVPNADHDWTAFDAAIRHLLFYFSPKTPE